MKKIMRHLDGLLTCPYCGCELFDFSIPIDLELSSPRVTAPSGPTIDVRIGNIRKVEAKMSDVVQSFALLLSHHAMQCSYVGAHDDERELWAVKKP